MKDKDIEAINPDLSENVITNTSQMSVLMKNLMAFEHCMMAVNYVADAELQKKDCSISNADALKIARYSLQYLKGERPDYFQNLGLEDTVAAITNNDHNNTLEDQNLSNSHSAARR